ncbi:hypothetical protein J2T10_003082 [Paenarthrobacter nicotinovorans]|jgi:hypothetical protein|uniref:Uncharacterized protein n=1 Tax=Paenarthrobacter nicotinovorans TaxID=29320 RepID=A0ABT9TP28_PAENI|nr:hypothetical protein [Paenarthrobacter nicotinovorans]MDQ0103417.1 hypothetical protein [Paenarthrobacter nicotinovorans]
MSKQSVVLESRDDAHAAIDSGVKVLMAATPLDAD